MSEHNYPTTSSSSQKSTRRHSIFLSPFVKSNQKYTSFLSTKEDISTAHTSTPFYYGVPEEKPTEKRKELSRLFAKLKASAISRGTERLKKDPLQDLFDSKDPDSSNTCTPQDNAPLPTLSHCLSVDQDSLESVFDSQSKLSSDSLQSDPMLDILSSTSSP
ncbi:hypothetical protein BDF14DRAFT_1885121 [Spinellus fusiger]|nr:hypothetical protein BDF14DRAFT_1885121 [Spinellus fusiger]